MMQMDKQWMYRKALEISYTGRIFLFTHSCTDVCICLGGGGEGKDVHSPLPLSPLEAHSSYTPLLPQLPVHHLLHSCAGFREPQNRMPSKLNPRLDKTPNHAPGSFGLWRIAGLCLSLAVHTAGSSSSAMWMSSEAVPT